MTLESEKYDAWKSDLISLMIDGFIFPSGYSNELAEKVGYYYKCYAPAYLYKYYSDSIDRFKDVASNKMWFSAPCNYNDVFDCDLFFDEEGIIESIKNLFPDKRGYRVGSPMWRELKSTSSKSLKELRKTVEEMRKTIGIVCLSESCDSLLMWAHYAHNHSGFCVEYELMRFNSEVDFSPVPVIYTNDKVCIHSLSTDAEQRETVKAFIRCLTSKYTEWAYEREWRIIRDNAACGDRWNNEKCGAVLDVIRPHSIILGCNVGTELEHTAKAYCEENSINLYKMEKDEKLFRLNKKKILIYDEDI